VKTAFLFLVLFGGLANLWTCGSARAVAVEDPALPKAPEHVTPPKAGETATEAALREARDLVTNLRGKLAEGDARVAALAKDVETERREAFLGTLRASCLWVAGLALLGAFACAVLAYVSPIAKPTLAKVAVACGILVVLATGCAWAVSWLPTIGVVALLVLACVVIAAAVLAAVRWFPTFAHAAVHAADGYQQAATFLRTDIRKAIDEENRGHQVDKGGKVFLEGNRLHELAKAHRDKVGAL
jgi:hypothetical protein